MGVAEEIVKAATLSRIVADIETLRERPDNPRRTFLNQGEIDASVKANGVLMPLVVRPLEGDVFEILDGARRYRAARHAGLQVVPIDPREMTDQEAAEFVMILALQRQGLEPMDEAQGFEDLRRAFGYDVATIAERVRVDGRHVARRLALLNLTPDWQRDLAAGIIGIAHAEILARLQPSDQKAAREVVIRGRLLPAEEAPPVASVGELRRWIAANVHLDLARVPWDQASSDLVPSAGPCTTCPKRTGANALLFSDVTNGDTCTDRGCFQIKMAAHLKAMARALHEETGRQAVLVSSSFAAGRPGVTGSDEYVVADHRTMCQSAEPALMIDGGDAGKRLLVCRSASCSVHRRGADPAEARETDPERQPAGRATKLSAKEREQRSRERLEVARRQAILTAITDKAPASLSGDVLGLIAEVFQAETWNEHRKQVAQALGITKKGEKDSAGAMERYLKKATAKQAVVVILGLTAARDLRAKNASGSSDRDRLITIAEALKVDVKAITASLTASPAKPAAKVGKKATKAARPRAKK